MSSKAILEADGKRLLLNNLKDDSFVLPMFASVEESSEFDEVLNANHWLSGKVYVQFCCNYFYCFHHDSY